MTNYEKILTEIRPHACGIRFEADLNQRFKIIDEFVIDHSPLADKYESNYYQTFQQTGGLSGGASGFRAGRGSNLKANL